MPLCDWSEIFPLVMATVARNERALSNVDDGSLAVEKDPVVLPVAGDAGKALAPPDEMNG